MEKSGNMNDDDEEDYSSEDSDEDPEEYKEEKDRNTGQIDLTKLVRAMPETLEGFTYTSKKNDNLENNYKFKAFITGLIERGVSNFSFNRITFTENADDPNIKLFRSIFTDRINNSRVKYLRFHECKNVEFLANAFDSLEGLETVSLTKCDISGMFCLISKSNFLSFYRSQYRKGDRSN